jgi:hypothetical protein
MLLQLSQPFHDCHALEVGHRSVLRQHPQVSGIFSVSAAILLVLILVL